jgi:hypothetical protein
VSPIIVIYDATYPEMEYGTYSDTFTVIEDASQLVDQAVVYDFGYLNAEWTVDGGAADVSCPVDSAVELLTTLDTTADLIISNQDCAVGGLSQALRTDDGDGHGGALDLVDTSTGPPPDSLIAAPIADTVDIPNNQDEYEYNGGVVNFELL